MRLARRRFKAWTWSVEPSGAVTQALTNLELMRRQEQERRTWVACMWNSGVLGTERHTTARDSPMDVRRGSTDGLMLRWILEQTGAQVPAAD